MFKSTHEGLDYPSISNACIIRIPQISKRLGLSRSAIYDRLSPRSPRHDALFPRPIRLNSKGKGGAIGWLEDDVLSYIQACRDIALADSSRQGGGR